MGHNVVLSLVTYDPRNMLLVIGSIRIVQHYASTSVLSFVPGLLSSCLLHTVHTLQYVTKAGEEPVNKDAITTQKYYRSLQGECKTWTVDYGLDHELFPSKIIARLMLVLPSVLVSDGMRPRICSQTSLP